jgi:ABC-type sugar transport system permease subunit
MYLYATGFEAGDLHYAAPVGWALVLLLGLFTAALLLAYRYTDAPPRRRQ